MNYEVLSFTLAHEPGHPTCYSHKARFIEGDIRTVKFDDGEVIDQVFQGSAEVGGWYDID